MIALMYELSNPSPKPKEPSEAAKLGVVTGLAGLTTGGVGLMAADKAAKHAGETRNELLRLQTLFRQGKGVINRSPGSGEIDQNPQIDI